MDEIFTDGGSIYTSKESQDPLVRYDTSHRTSGVYNPSLNKNGQTREQALLT
jgi:hypothetical protein